MVMSTSQITEVSNFRYLFPSIQEIPRGRVIMSKFWVQKEFLLQMCMIATNTLAIIRESKKKLTKTQNKQRDKIIIRMLLN